MILISLKSFGNSFGNSYTYSMVIINYIRFVCPAEKLYENVKKSSYVLSTIYCRCKVVPAGIYLFRFNNGNSRTMKSE